MVEGTRRTPGTTAGRGARSAGHARHARRERHEGPSQAASICGPGPPDGAGVPDWVDRGSSAWAIGGAGGGASRPDAVRLGVERESGRRVVAAGQPGEQNDPLAQARMRVHRTGDLMARQSLLPRWLHRLYARFLGYFWLPCPICGRCFGGHEGLRLLYLNASTGQRSRGRRAIHP